MRFVAPIIVCALAVVGCASAAQAPTVGGSISQLQARSAFDLGCPHTDLSLYNFDDRSKGVAGCGRRLTYVRSCQLIDGVNSCTWMLDTPSSAQQAWPSAAAVASPPSAPLLAPPVVGRSHIEVRPPRPSSAAPRDPSSTRDLPCGDRSCARFNDPNAPNNEVVSPPVQPPGGQAVDRGF